MTEENNYYTDERIRSDLDYQRAQRTARCMLDTGLISDDEFNKLCDINRKTFSPLFVESENCLLCIRKRVIDRH